jgi:hypothetical protein
MSETDTADTGLTPCCQAEKPLLERLSGEADTLTAESRTFATGQLHTLAEQLREQTLSILGGATRCQAVSPAEDPDQQRGDCLTPRCQPEGLRCQPQLGPLCEPRRYTRNPDLRAAADLIHELDVAGAGFRLDLADPAAPVLRYFGPGGLRTSELADRIRQNRAELLALVAFELTGPAETAEVRAARFAVLDRWCARYDAPPVLSAPSSASTTP